MADIIGDVRHWPEDEETRKFVAGYVEQKEKHMSFEEGIAKAQADLVAQQEVHDQVHRRFAEKLGRWLADLAYQRRIRWPRSVC